MDKEVFENVYETADEGEVNSAVAAEKRNKIARNIIALLAVCFCAYAVYNIISQQAEIAQLRTQTETINQQLTEQQAQNDEYTRLLNSGEKEYMEKIAIEKLGYAYPEERRFYLVDGGK